MSLLIIFNINKLPLQRIANHRVFFVKGLLCSAIIASMGKLRRVRAKHNPRWSQSAFLTRVTSKINLYWPKRPLCVTHNINPHSSLKMPNSASNRQIPNRLFRNLESRCRVFAAYALVVRFNLYISKTSSAKRFACSI